MALVLLPAAVLAPIAAVAIKCMALRLTRATVPTIKLLFGVALLEFLLWEVAYPAGALLDLSPVSMWREPYLVIGAILVAGLLTWTNFRILRGAAMSVGLARPLGFLFALSTPLCLVLLAASAWGLAALGLALSVH